VTDISENAGRLGFYWITNTKKKDMNIRTVGEKQPETPDIIFQNGRRASLCLIIAVLVIMGCANDRDKTLMVEGESFKGVILGEEHSDLMYLKKRYPVEKLEFWTPNKKDVVEAELAIPRFLEEGGGEEYSTELVFEIVKNLDKYIRQYCGVIIDKRKYIYCNFIRNYGSQNLSGGYYKNWENELICNWAIADGGSDYFDILYDVKKNECVQISIRD